MTKIETSFERLKKAILELKDGYPEFIFWGKVEYFVKTGKSAVDLLVRHRIIEKITQEELDSLPPQELAKMSPRKEDRLNSYRLTAKGVDLAIAMINLDYAEKMKMLTIAILVLGGLTFLLGLNQLLFPFLK